MATNKRVFTLRLSDEVFDKIGALATREHRSITNYIEFVLLKHLEEVEKAEGTINVDNSPKGVYRKMFFYGKKCCNGVRWKQSVQNFEGHLFSGTATRRRTVLEQTWKPKSCSHFTLRERGKSAR